MIFQDSIGIEIKENQIIIAYVQDSFKGASLKNHAVYSLEKDKPLKEKLGAASALFIDFKQENNIGTSNVFIGIPEELAIFKEIEFPLAVKENLRATLRYEMEKYIPLSPDDIYFDYQIVEEDKAANRIHVLLAVARKTAIDPYINFSRMISGGISGIEDSSISIANFIAYSQGKNSKSKGNDKEIQSRKPPFIPRMFQEIRTELRTQLDSKEINGFSKFGLSSSELVPAFGLGLKGLWPAPMQINFLPFEYRKKPGRSTYYVMIALAVLVILSGLAWGGSHVLRQRIAIKELDAEMKRLTSEIQEIDRIQEQISVMESRMESLETLTHGYVSLSDIMRELTQIIPETAWVRDFFLSEKGIQLNGYADSASELIGLLEASPLFKEVVFLSTIIKEKDGKERFSIGMKTELFLE